MIHSGSAGVSAAPIARQSQLWFRRNEAMHLGILRTITGGHAIRVDDLSELFLGRQIPCGNSHESKARIDQRLSLPRVGVLTDSSLMTPIIEFNDGDHGEIRAAQHEISNQLREAIANGLPLRLIFRDVDQLRQRDLDKNLMVGIEAQQTLVERLLSSGQQFGRHHRPWRIRERLTHNRIRPRSPIHNSPQVIH